LTAITGFMGDVPVTAMVKMPSGETQYVKYENLRPASMPRPVQDPAPNKNKAALGDFMIFESSIYGESAYCGGVIASLTEEQGLYDVQVHAAGESGKSWIPSWSKIGSAVKSSKA
jgi:hypothetical protein